MKPGARTRSPASIVLRAGASPIRPIAATLPPRTPTSARYQAPPLPSMTRAFRTRRSNGSSPPWSPRSGKRTGRAASVSRRRRMDAGSVSDRNRPGRHAVVRWPVRFRLILSPRCDSCRRPIPTGSAACSPTSTHSWPITPPASEKRPAPRWPSWRTTPIARRSSKRARSSPSKSSAISETWSVSSSPEACRSGRTRGTPTSGGLTREFRSGSAEYLLDRLLVAAIVEARGCERLALVAAGHPEGAIRDFYRTLARSEARHQDLYADLARRIFPAEAVNARWDELARLEERLLSRLPCRPALFHVGATETPCEETPCEESPPP